MPWKLQISSCKSDFSCQIFRLFEADSLHCLLLYDLSCGYRCFLEWCQWKNLSKKQHRHLKFLRMRTSVFKRVCLYMFPCVRYCSIVWKRSWKYFLFRKKFNLACSFWMLLSKTDWDVMSAISPKAFTCSSVVISSSSLARQLWSGASTQFWRPAWPQMVSGNILSSFRHHAVVLK